MGDYIALDKKPQFLFKGTSRDLCDCGCIATNLDFIQNMRKASSAAEPIPNAATCNTLTTRDGVIRKIRQPGVGLTHRDETLGAPVVYQNEPEWQADSSPKTDKASGDDELPGIKQYLQGKGNIIAQLQKIQDPHERKRRDEQSE